MKKISLLLFLLSACDAKPEPKEKEVDYYKMCYDNAYKVADECIVSKSYEECYLELLIKMLDNCEKRYGE